MKANAGQAAIEFVAALFLLLIILIGMLFLNDRSLQSLLLQAGIREDAGYQAMASTLGTAPDAIRDWNDGEDKTPYTADDRPQKSANASTTLQLLSDRSVANESDWAKVDSDVQLPFSMLTIHRGPSLVNAVPSVRKKEEEQIEVPNFIRENIYRKDEVTIREEIYFPLLGGIY